MHSAPVGTSISLFPYLRHIHRNCRSLHLHFFLFYFDFLFEFRFYFGFQFREILNQVFHNEVVDEFLFDGHWVFSQFLLTWHAVLRSGFRDHRRAVSSFKFQNQRKREHLLLQIRGQFLDLFDDVLISAKRRVAAGFELLDVVEDLLALVGVHFR